MQPEKRERSLGGVVFHFPPVVRVSFFVNQSLSEDLRGVWECEETSVAGAEWVKRRAAGQGAES